jgi:hypothetical protein
MRNYQQFFFTVTHWIDGGMNPRDTYLIQESLEDCAEGIADLEASLRDNGFTVTGSEILGFRYFCFDKTNMSQVLAPNAANYWLNPTLPPQFNGLGTPRDGWTDDDGIERKPPPSDKPSKSGGKGGTLALVDSLNEFLASLLSAGFKDTPGSLIDRLLKFIINLNAGRQIDGAKLAILLQEIEDAVLNPHGS